MVFHVEVVEYLVEGFPFKVGVEFAGMGAENPAFVRCVAGVGPHGLAQELVNYLVEGFVLGRASLKGEGTFAIASFLDVAVEVWGS